MFNNIFCEMKGKKSYPLAEGGGGMGELLLLKKVSSARLGESDIHPISLKTPAPQYQPIDRKKRKGKRVEHYRRDRAA